MQRDELVDGGSVRWRGRTTSRFRAVTAPWRRVVRRSEVRRDSAASWESMGYIELANLVRNVCTLCDLTHAKAGEGQSIAVTSACAREGRSTVARLLAISLAQDHADDVLLLEADLLRPSIAADFGMVPDPGLCEVLDGSASVREALRHTRIGNLKVLPAGGAPANASRLLRSQALRDLLDRLADEFAFVVLDLPAVLDSSDAAVVAKQVGGTVLVVRAGETEQHDVLQAQTLLGGATLHGVLLNRYRTAVPAFARRLLDQ
ncbi:MAG TPA: CpsD/CapB family tyrosine-protein kinase [Pseudonocardiaceae bacterium]|nr:CpsD/CapB family tyrosine-protein kinase [Pseudonocardiaceae bacterium]